ncbi:putative superfamily III holin-X [Novosphingobium sp. PhB165]|uniref:phage holin family protein n=1 Tax=Novosphingobium sp. PhB165 TaxID=2485105 RepID=UPI0010475A32|nr:phage holin family protein [Novosphingobium sp. PhB165]TCM21993.1 putative superfamily III holin-X [Novosphingobium sp. PhB165]
MLDPDTSLRYDSDIEDISLAQDLKLLAEEARTLAQAELAFQKTRAAYVGAEARTIALFGVLAAVVVFFALMALVFGLVLSLASVLGPWLATAVATLALLVIAAILGLSARGRVKRVRSVLSNGGTD